MESTVLADVIPLLPSILKKVPWQLRAALLLALAIAGAYVIGAQFLGWPINHEVLNIVGIAALPAGAPALANVSISKGDGKEAYQRGYEAAQQVATALAADAPEVLQSAPVKDLENAVQAVEVAVPGLVPTIEAATAQNPAPVGAV